MTKIKRINKSLFPILILLLIARVSFAQHEKILTLDEAVQLSIQNSHKLAAANARMQQANALLQESKTHRLPEISAGGSAMWLNNPDFSLKTGKPGSDSSGRIPSVNEAAYAMVNVGIPIYAGGKIRYGIESAKYLAEAAHLDASNDTASIVLNTIGAYTNLYKASIMVNVIREHLNQAQHRDSVLLRLENNGLLARNDRLKAQLQTANIELTLLEAKSNLKMANTNMKLLLGIRDTSELIIDSSVFESAIHEIPFAELITSSTHNRKDALALQKREYAAHTGIRVAKADWYPQLSVTGGYIAAYIPHILTLTNAVNAGIGIKYNISSIWKTKSKIANAQAKLDEIHANELELQDAIKLQLTQSFEAYALSKQKLVVYQKAIVQAEENFRITKNKFDNELVNMSELLDANVLLLQSRINYSVAKADLYFSYQKLLHAAGQLSL